ncbi:MAG: serine/threonine-protein kinase [Polyangiales bacterium]
MPIHSASRVAEPGEARAPSRVGRFDLVTRIGAGGMASVYLARSGSTLRFGRSFERVVAVKLMHPHLASDEGFVEMFFNEARVAAMVQHRNVVSVLDVGMEDNALYAVMDYVEGDTLAAIQSTAAALGRGVPLGVTLRVVLDALAGLDAAHELRDEAGELLNLVHRDVTPQNILVGVDGVARLTDFGVARARGCLVQTHAGMLKGKLSYMAPEQLEGAALDRRVDVFAMGVTLWETLALRRLFPGRNTYEQARRDARAPYRSLTEFTRAVPPELDVICRRALAQDPDERFASAAEFGDAIERELGDAVATAQELGGFLSAVAREKVEREREALRVAARPEKNASRSGRAVLRWVAPQAGAVVEVPASRAKAKGPRGIPLGAAADASILEPIPLVPRRKRRAVVRAPTLPSGGFFPATEQTPPKDDHSESVTRELPLRAPWQDELPSSDVPAPIAPAERAAAAPEAASEMVRDAEATTEAKTMARWKPLSPAPRPAADGDPHAWLAEVMAVLVLLAVAGSIAWVTLR